MDCGRDRSSNGQYASSQGNGLSDPKNINRSRDSIASVFNVSEWKPGVFQVTQRSMQL
jgi:hypothetical protein